MKLLYCPKCQDIIKLRPKKRFCQCGKSWGLYRKGILTDTGLKDWTALYSEGSIPIVINGISFRTAIESRGDSGRGREFNAFVVQRNCPSVEYVPAALPPDKLEIYWNDEWHDYTEKKE